MELNRLLNALVTALSLATVFITLMSFLIFKIRQFPKKSSGSGNDHIKEGIYFRRYDPYNAPDAVPVFVEKKSWKPKKLGLGWSAAVFFGIISVAIFGALVIQRIAADTAKSELIAKQKAEAKIKAETLAAKGLTKKYDFDPKLESKPLTETLDASVTESLKTELTVLRTKRIVVLKEDPSAKHHAANQTKAVETWTEFLKGNEVPFRVVDTIKVDASEDILIVPQMMIINSKTRANLEALAQAGVGILATGPVGVLDGTAAAAPTEWANRLFGVALLPNPTPGTFHASTFIGDHAPYSMIPAGLLADWVPTDNSYNATPSDFKSVAVSQSEYNGRSVVDANGRSRPYAVFSDSPSRRSAWLAIEPSSFAKLNSSEKVYAQSFLVSSLRWLARAPEASTATWKHGAHSAFLASVDSEDKFEGASRLAEIFKKKQTPATFFAVSDLYAKTPGLEKVVDATMEIASHTTDHADLLGMPIAQQFDRIQNARIAIESLSGKPVVGFRPPEERYDEQTINAALQNHVEYFFGDQKFYRYTPLVVGDGKMIYFPRTVWDDFNLTKAKFASDSEMIQKMKADLARTEEVGGAYFMSAHSQVFGQPAYTASVEGFLDDVALKDIWRANYGEVAQWWRGRNGIRTEIKAADETHYTLKISNVSDVALNEVVFHLDSIPADSLSVSPETTLKFEVIAEPGGNYKLSLAQLGPHKDAIFSFEKGSDIRQPASETKSEPKTEAKPKVEAAEKPKKSTAKSKRTSTKFKLGRTKN